MNATDLIKALAGIISNYGNLPVGVFDPERNGDSEVTLAIVQHIHENTNNSIHLGRKNGEFISIKA